MNNFTYAGAVASFKLFPPEVSPADADWSKGETLAGLRVNSVIACPSPGMRLAANRPFVVEGYAVAADNNTVTSVELSLDNGTTWHATKLSGSQHWAWKLWQLPVSLPPGNYTLVVRATDSAGNCQPPDLRTVWNFKGYMNNAWHRVNITVIEQEF